MPTMALVKIDGTKLQRVRKRRLMSREELAAKTGLHRDHIGRLERGEVEAPRMGTIRDLAEALSVEPDEILDLED